MSKSTRSISWSGQRMKKKLFRMCLYPFLSSKLFFIFLFFLFFFSSTTQVMQELDDLVNDLSNMSFNREIEFKKKPVQMKPHENLSTLKENEVSSPPSSRNEIRVNGLDHVSVVPKDTSRKTEVSVTFSASVTQHSIPSKEYSVLTQQENIPTNQQSRPELPVSQIKSAIPPPVASKPKVPVKPVSWLCGT